MQRRNKKKLGIILCGILCLVFFLSGCDSMEDKRNIKQWEALASENAYHYIKEKYGFEAEVKDCRCNRADDLFGSSPTSHCLVTMKYKNREFYVWIDGDSKNMEGIDNYQAKEISQAMNKKITDCLGERPAYFQMIQTECSFCGGPEGAYDNMFHGYYDGTNLYEVLAEGSTEYCIFFADGRDVSQDSFDEIVRHFDMDENLYVAIFEEISFVSEEGLKASKDAVIADLRCNSGSMGIGEEKIYIDSTLSVAYREDESEKEAKQYIRKKYDDIIYCYEKEEEKDWEIEKSEQEMDVEAFEGCGFIEPRKISNSYSIKNRKGNNAVNTYITVYFPKEMITKEDAETVRIIYAFADDEGEYYRKSAFINEIGTYYAGTISCNPNKDGVQFMLAVEEGE